MEDLALKIRNMLDKQEITEVYHRYCRGVDRGDLDLLRSVYHEDAIDDHGMYKGNGLDFAAWILNLLDTQSRTMHLVTNITIDLQGDVAYSEAYCLAVSEDSEKSVTVFNRYVDRFERRSGEWKIAARVVVFDIDRSIPDHAKPNSIPGYTWGTRDKNDPVYQRLS